jgi:DNA-binding CsgD family transcriptional regulator
MAKSTGRAEGRFKQLCCLGLGGEAVIPALLAELHAIVPSYSNNFFFADAAGLPANIYDENPGFYDLMPMYREVFYEREDHAVKGLAYSEASATQFGVYDAAAMIGSDYVAILARSDIGDAIWRPLGYNFDFLRMFIRDGRQKRTLGCVDLYTSTGARSWTAEEKRRLARLEPFFAHALMARSEDNGFMAESDRSGIIVADEAGRPLHLSAEARRLLFLATHPRNAPGGSSGSFQALPEEVVRICRSLSRASLGGSDASAPTCHYRNVWGSFRFRAEWLGTRDGCGRVAVTINHEEPLAVRIARSVNSLPLTHRQAEICLLMANGLSCEQIAERLGISGHTAREHARWVYHRLEVHNRTELVSLLLSTGR